MDFGTLERRAWSDPGVARTYAELFSEAVAPSIPALLRAAGVGPGRRVLDVACGPGPISRAALVSGALPISLDLSGPMLAEARVRLRPSARPVQASALRLPFQDETFDALVCSLGLLHFPSPQLALAEGRRVLRKGGRAAWSVWGPDATLLRIIPESMESLGLRPNLPDAPGFFRFAQPGVFESDLVSAGLSPEPVTIVPYMVPISSVMEFWQMFRHGTARTRAGMASLSEHDQGRLREEVARRLEPWRVGVSFRVPASVVIGSGRRP